MNQMVFTGLLESLTRPHPSIIRESERRRARFFSTMILTDLVVIAFSVLPFARFLGLAAGVGVMLALLATSLLVYWLARIGHLRVAVQLAVFSIYLIILVVYVAKPAPGLATSMLFPVLFASLFATLPVMAGWSLVTIVTVIVVAAFFPGDAGQPGASTMYLVSMALIVGISTWFRNRDDEQLECTIALQKRVEDALRESNRRYDELVANMPVMVFRLRRTPDGTESFEYVSPQCRELNGIEAAAVLRDPLLLINQHLPADQLDYVRRKEESAKALIPFTWEGRAIVNGQQRWRRLEANVRRLPDGSLVWDGIQIDTTAQRVAEAQLRESQRFIETVTDAVPDVIYVYDIETHLMAYNNSRTLPLLGHEPEVFARLEAPVVRAQIHPEDVEAFFRTQDGLRTLGDDEVIETEFRIKHADGTWRWLHSRQSIFLRKTGGKPPQILGILQDITIRKQAEFAEREQRLLVDAIHETTGILNTTLDLDEVLDYILERISRVVAFDGASIMLIENDIAHVVRIVGYEDKRVEPFDTQTYPIGDSYFLRTMAQTRQGVCIPDTSTHPYFKIPPNLTWIRSFIGVPIWAGGRFVAAILLDSRTSNFYTQAQVDRLQTFAAQVATAIQNAQLYEQTQLWAAANERQRLARELHDSVTQTLFSASMVAQTLPMLWERDQEIVRLELDHLAKLTRGALAEMRTLLIELRPLSLETADLGELIRYLLDAIAARAMLQVKLDIDGHYNLPSEVQVAAFRIAQESINNIEKHAHASAIDVVLHRTQASLRLMITDDGQGFDPTQVTGDHFGLTNMHERAEGLGASLAIVSRAGHGCRVDLAWPHPVPTAPLSLEAKPKRMIDRLIR